MISKFRNSIVGKIMSGYGTIIFLAVVSTLVSMYATWQNRKIDRIASEAYYPMVISLKQMEGLVAESYKLTNNWIYQPNLQEKEKLKVLHETTVVEQIERFNSTIDKLDDEAAIEEARSITKAIHQLLAYQVIVMEKLAKAESYSNDDIVDEIITVMDEKITPTYKEVGELINQSFISQNHLLQQANSKKESFAVTLTYLYLGNIVLFVIIAIYATYFSVNKIAKPIADLSNLITMVSEGKFVSVALKKSKDEIGRMTDAIQNMLTGLKAKAEFAENIGKGNYDSKFELLSEADTMGEALITMRDNLNQAAEDDRKRNWATEGLAKFAEILRSRNDNLSALSDNIISNLVKYMKANQGALFLLNDDRTDDTFIEMVACFAYDRKKYLNKRIEVGEGITGQCILEKDTIYLSDIPDNYVRITSGLGEALPKNLLIVPLKLDDTIFGVVEIASFQTILPHQIEFVEKLGESIASAISSVKVNTRTKRLLEETQVQAEQMRAQEEEMRQNMEELSATQEEMQRILQEVQAKEEYLNEVLNSSKDSIYTLDRSFKLISFNKAFSNQMSEAGLHVSKDADMMSVLKGKEREKLRSYYNRALAGNHFEITDTYVTHGKEKHILMTFAPLRNEDDTVYAIVCFSQDITAMVQARQEAEKLANESQRTAEEMKSQEEELRQNMEELSATQEEMQHILKETQSKERYLNNLLDASQDAIFTLGKDYKLGDFNKSFSEHAKHIGFKVARGFDILSMYPANEQEEVKRDIDKIFKGEFVKGAKAFAGNTQKDRGSCRYSPLRNETGEIVAVAGFIRDLTGIKPTEEELMASSIDTKNGSSKSATK
jgi:PAS domain S-box-containing protein